MSSRQTPHSNDTILADSSAPSLLSSSSNSLPGGVAPVVLAGRYELLAMVGAGGMGTVYRARDRELDDEVALKVLRPEVVSERGMLDRFRRELKLARRVTHRNVARAHDIGEDGEQRFLTMEFIDGEPLSALLARRQALPSARVIELTREVCHGLSAAHAVGVIHCDLKPENLLIERSGRVVITDFGIARGVFDAGLRKTIGSVLGTPAYMAPEQVEGSRDLTPATDLYALGVMLYELFTGELPWTGESVFAVAAARLHREPPDPRKVRPDLPEDLARIILRCMARSPQARFAQASELEAALGGICIDGLCTGPVPALRATILSPAVRPADHAKSVAVLPFRATGSSDDAYLADGLTEDLIDQLSMVPGLKVRPRGAVMHAASGEAKEVGRELGVQVVVEGSLRRAGDKLRISTRLISVTDGFQLWAKRADCAPADVLSLSDELAQSIAQALSVTQAGGGRTAPTDPRALDAYFRGRFEYHKFTPEALARAVALLEEAKSLAPDDPMILAGYALACTRHWFFGTAGRAEQAREAAERAQKLDPQRAEPSMALASHAFFTGELPRAMGLLMHALKLNPDLPDVHDLLGKILVESGPAARGYEHLERAFRLDPAFRNARSNIGRALALERRWDEAYAYLARISADPDGDGAWATLARLALWQRDTERARALLADPRSQSLQFARILLDFVAHPDEAIVERLGEVPIISSPGATWRGRAIYHQIGCEFACVLEQSDQALALLEQAVADGLFDILWLDGCPLLAPLRAHPRFAPIRAVVDGRAQRIRAELR